MPNIKPILDNDWHAILAIHWHLLYYQYLHWEILANVCMYEYIYMCLSNLSQRIVNVL